MAGGWTRDDNLSEQIEDSIMDAVARARRKLPQGQSLLRCAECDTPIPEARRKALPGVRLCLDCQNRQDKMQPPGRSGYNRRGSKDSQLR